MHAMEYDANMRRCMYAVGDFPCNVTSTTSKNPTTDPALNQQLTFVPLYISCSSTLIHSSSQASILSVNDLNAY